MYWENYFAQLFMKVIGKRKPFKTNNSSEFLYGLHISNVPTMRGERCNERFGGKLHSNLYNSQLCWIQSCLAGGPFLHHYYAWVDHFTPSTSIKSITRGGNVVNAYER